MVFWILATLLVVVIYFANQHFLTYWTRCGVPQGETKFLLGDITESLLGRKPIGDLFADFYNKFKNNRIHGIYYSYRPALIINDPELIQEVMIKDFNSFHDRGLFNDTKVNSLNCNLFLLRGQKWRDLRVKLSPTFTSGKLKGMYPIMRDCAETLHNYLVKKTEHTKRFEFDSKELPARYTTNVISSVAFGIESDCINDPDNVFRKMRVKIFEKNWNRTIFQILAPGIVNKFKIKQFPQDLEDFFFSVVKQTIIHRENNKEAAERKDFMQLMIQLKDQGYLSVDKEDEREDKDEDPNNTKKITVEEIVGQAYLFFTAGFETSSSTMNFCMYELCKNPDQQEKVHEEIDRLVKSRDINAITYDLLGSMKYLDCCIDETLRKYPILPLLNRQSTKSHTFTGTNMTIEKGVPIIIPILGLQRDPEIYDDPLKFQPERFLDSTNGNGKAKGLFYLPLGDGPRNCVGARMGKLQTKLGLVALLLKFKFELVDQSLMYKEIEFDPKQFVLTPKHCIILRATPR